MDEFTGKVVLITGAGRGLGREVALAFASQGARIAANDINPLSLDETVSHILRSGGSAKSYIFDIAKRMPIEGMLAQVLEDFGRIDFLVNHAAVMPDAHLLEMDEWEFHRTLDVNLGGPFFTIQQVGRVMRQQGGGAIVNLISTGGKDEFRMGHSACFTSQAGLIGLTQAAASELSGWNIRVNLICRGSTLPGLASLVDSEFAAFCQWVSGVANLTQDTHADPVSMVLFLCSESAVSITGKVIGVESGP